MTVVSGLLFLVHRAIVSGKTETAHRERKPLGVAACDFWYPSVCVNDHKKDGMCVFSPAIVCSLALGAYTCVYVCVCGGWWWMLLNVGAERRCSDHWLLSSSQDGLYGIKSGSSREFMLSGKGECFWIHEEGSWIKSENPPSPKQLFPRVICARVSPRPLPRSRHLALSYPPRARASPLVLSSSPQARRGIPHSKAVQFSPSHPTVT